MAHAYDIGLMMQPGTGYRNQIESYPYWAADNGCFSQGERFNTGKWLAWLESLIPFQQSCLFAVAPDVIHDARATISRSLPLIPIIRDLGYSVAFVAQNGLTVETTPWNEFDCLFIGGDDQFKLGHAVQPLITEAKQRGKLVHQGRCNSLRRLKIAQVQGCDSADGTFLGFGPDKNLPRVLNWLRQVNQQPTLNLWGV